MRTQENKTLIQVMLNRGERVDIFDCISLMSVALFQISMPATNYIT